MQIQLNRAAALLISAACIISPALCGCGESPKPDISVLQNHENEYVFSISADEFIKSYNALYRKDKKSDCLRPLNQWMKDTYDTAIHSSHETTVYTFTENESKWLLPTLSIYVPANADYIQEITLNFDDHGYTAEMYTLYEEYCFYTLKVFFPSLSNDKIIELYSTLNDLAYDNFTNEKYSADSIPCALYHKDGIGLYPYFANGEWVHLCIIPVTDDYIIGIEAKGVDIHQIV